MIRVRGNQQYVCTVIMRLAPTESNVCNKVLTAPGTVVRPDRLKFRSTRHVEAWVRH
jgi:hypothetical protein